MMDYVDFSVAPPELRTALTLRSIIIWLILLTLPVSLGGSVPREVFCVRADGSVVVEAYGVCDAVEAPCVTLQLSPSAPSPDAVLPVCGVCTDLPLRAHVPATVASAARHAPVERTTAVMPRWTPASDLLRLDCDPRSPHRNTAHTPLASLRTVVLLV